MKGKHPKRRRDKYNPYRIYEIDGKHYISFKDSHIRQQEFEITKSIYDAFNTFELEDLSYLNEWDNHIEHLELQETSLAERAVVKSESVEDIVLQKLEEEKIYAAIGNLSEAQKRRVVLYFFNRKTYQEIAVIEECSVQAVAKSISQAIEKIKKILD